MLFNSNYYLINNFCEVKFRFALEKHLEKSEKDPFEAEFIEQVIAAYLQCNESNRCPKICEKANKYLSQMDVEYLDYRTYRLTSEIENDSLAEEALRIFCELYLVQQTAALSAVSSKKD